MAAEVTVSGGGRVLRPHGMLIELQAIRWGPVAGSVAAATMLAILDLTVWAGGPGSVLTWLCAALLGGAGALAFDQPAGSVTDAAPYPVGLRVASRLLVTVGGGVGWCAYAWAVSDGQPQGAFVSSTALTVIGEALLLAGPAAALVLSGPDNRDPGALVASGLVAAVVGLLVLPLPGGLAPLDVADAWNRATVLWTLVAIASGAVIVQSSRR
jgi:hypothetical protein